ncbi:AMP-binding protein [Streptomyces humidus]|uniref:AMP-binding protein n=1 Tax=Streptomyces humidus TaxID=52259 RepID=A0A918GAI6_9ACTN|nr:AMP-binding protein [Streptomyces humidus]GGS27276.1 AMP-binding protein [Streptomyces humidus]
MREPLTTSLWSRDDSVPLVEYTVGSLLAERASTHGDALALVGTAHGTGEQCRLTYQDLYTEARRVATALLRLAEPGEFVALWAPNVIEWPVIQYGAALAGVTLVALNPVLRADELVYAVNHSGAAVLLHADVSRDYDLAAVAASVPSRCPALREVVSLSARDRWLAESADPPATAAVRDADAPVMLQYTSGTTGLPKGVLLRHRSLVNVAKLTVERAETEPGAVQVNPLPMFHTAGCVVATLGSLWLGGCMLLVEHFRPAPVLELMEKEQATVLFCVPAILGALVEAARDTGGTAAALRTVMVGGANVPAALIETTRQVFGASVHNLYGQTELAPTLSATGRSDTPEDLANTVGRPLPQVECKIVNPITGAVQQLGASGEICARGYQQMIGYLHDPEATARTVDAEGWVHTGDLGVMDERGVITITGRLKDLIIRGGENIAPVEIETCLLGHEAVLEAAVIALPDEQWGEAVTAVVRLRGEPYDGLRDALVAHCRGRLAKYKVPQHWYAADEMPVTPAGKVRKFKLREAVAAGILRPLG